MVGGFIYNNELTCARGSPRAWSWPRSWPPRCSGRPPRSRPASAHKAQYRRWLGQIWGRLLDLFKIVNIRTISPDWEASGLVWLPFTFPTLVFWPEQETFIPHRIFFWNVWRLSSSPESWDYRARQLPPGIDTWGWWIHNEEEGDDVTSSGNFNMFIKTFIERNFVERKYSNSFSPLNWIANCRNINKWIEVTTSKSAILFCWQ